MNAKYIYRLQKIIGAGNQLLPLTKLANAVLDYHNQKKPDIMTRKTARRIINQYLVKLGIIYTRNTEKIKHGTCYVYIIQQSGKEKSIKIGMSDNPEKRLAVMQTSSPFKLFLIAKIVAEDRTHALYLEKGMQERLKKYRLEGEWFRKEALSILRD